MIMSNDPDKDIHFETIIRKGMSVWGFLSLLAMIGGWCIPLGIGWFLFSQFSHPKTVALSMIAAGIIIKYSCLILVRYRAKKLLEKFIRDQNQPI